MFLFPLLPLLMMSSLSAPAARASFRPACAKMIEVGRKLYGEPTPTSTEEILQTAESALEISAPVIPGGNDPVFVSISHESAPYEGVVRRLQASPEERVFRKLIRLPAGPGCYLISVAGSGGNRNSVV